MSRLPLDILGGHILTTWGNTNLYGEAPPRVSTPYLFMYYFWQTRHPYRIPCIEKCCPSHIPINRKSSLR